MAVCLSVFSAKFLTSSPFTAKLPLPSSAFIGTYVSVHEPVSIFSNGNELAMIDEGTLVGLQWLGNLTFIVRQPEGKNRTIANIFVRYKLKGFFFYRITGKLFCNREWL